MTSPDDRDGALDPRRERELQTAAEEVQLVVDDPLSLDSRDDAPALVRALPVQSMVTVARKLRDEHRLDLVLPHASAEQIVGIFDLDGWERDRLAIPRVREWLDRIADAYREADKPRGALVGLMHATDIELWILANSAATAVAELEPGDDEQRSRVLEDMAALQTWDTPDGFFVVGVPDSELGRMSLRVLQAVYDDSLVEGRKLISAIKWSLHAEVEEDLLRWRRGRLADLGFPDWEEAMRLFAPLTREAVLRDDDDDDDEDEPAAGEARGTPGPRPPAAIGAPGDVLRRALDQLGNEDYDLRLREFLLLANELMAAQRFEPGDEALQERAVAQAQGTLNLACELLLAAEPQTDPEGFILDRIAAVGLRKLFRVGYGPLAKLRKAALALHRGGQVSLRSVGSLLDRPWGPALASLTPWYPELPLEGKSGSRPLRSLADVARATAAIAEAGALAKLTFTARDAGGFGVDPAWLGRVDEPERLRLGDLLRTALVGELLPAREPGREAGGDDGLRPLAPRDLLWARDELLTGGGRLAPAVEERFSQRCAALGLSDQREGLAEYLLPRLAIELAGLEDRGDGLPDLTRVAGLLTVQQVGVWLKLEG